MRDCERRAERCCCNKSHCPIFFFQAEDGIRDLTVTGVQTCALPISQDYGVLETITKVEPADNKCSKAKTTTVVRRKPGASPLLFGEFLMQLCAFVFLEDISGELPPYEETYLSVAMDSPMREAYSELEDDIRQALKEHKGNRSVLSTML